MTGLNTCMQRLFDSRHGPNWCILKEDLKSDDSIMRCYKCIESDAMRTQFLPYDARPSVRRATSRRIVQNRANSSRFMQSRAESHHLRENKPCLPKDGRVGAHAKP